MYTHRYTSIYSYKSSNIILTHAYRNGNIILAASYGSSYESQFIDSDLGTQHDA